MKLFFIVKALSIQLGLLFLIFGAGCGDKDDGAKPGKGASPAALEQELPDGLTPEQASKVVARVGEREITVGDVTRQINRLSPYIRRRWAAPEKRKEFLDKLIRVELLSQEAERLGLGDDPEVQRTIKQVMTRIMIKNDLEKNLLPTSVSEEELKKEYQKDFVRYNRPAQIRASQIVVKDRAEAVKIISELKATKRNSRLFRGKAEKISIDQQTKSRGGDIGYFSKPSERRDGEPDIPAEVAEAAWRLKEVGDITEKPVETGIGFHIVRLSNKRAETSQSFENAKRTLENKLLREKRREILDKFIEELKSKAKIEIFQENIAKLRINNRRSGNKPYPPIGRPTGPIPNGIKPTSNKAGKLNAKPANVPSHRGDS